MIYTVKQYSRYSKRRVHGTNLTKTVLQNYTENDFFRHLLHLMALPEEIRHEERFCHLKYINKA